MATRRNPVPPPKRSPRSNPLRPAKASFSAPRPGAPPPGSPAAATLSHPLEVTP